MLKEMGDSNENQSLSAPFKCPLTVCSDNISSSLLLSHFLKVHQHEEDCVDLKEIQENEKTSLMVSVSDNYLKMEKNICLGILAYNMGSSRKHPNVLLPREFDRYENNLPILIMATRANYIKLCEEDPDFIDPDADFLVIWLLMPENGKNQKLIGTLTVHNEDFTKSLSSLIGVRAAECSQVVREFMETETDFLTVNSGFLSEISTNGSIYIEVSVAENLS